MQEKRVERKIKTVDYNQGKLINRVQNSIYKVYDKSEKSIKEEKCEEEKNLLKYKLKKIRAAHDVEKNRLNLINTNMMHSYHVQINILST